MKICTLNFAAAAVLAASTIACATARAETFDFSYTFDDGGVASGVVEGNVQPDLNTVLVYSIDNLVVFGETIAPAVVGDYIYSPPGSVTFDGSSMNFAAADNTLTSALTSKPSSRQRSRSRELHRDRRRSKSTIPLTGP